jgi:hypothetical protein
MIVAHIFPWFYFQLPLAPVGTSTLTFSGSVLEGTKDLGRTIPSLFRFGFQDDEEPKLNTGQTCHFLSFLSTFIAVAPRRQSTASQRPSIDFGVFVFVTKGESPPSITT